MATRIVHINNSSLEVVFEGNLQKAPPLNRRGRKKWKERFFILRANRTFEFYKSKKAANAQKSPRRIVDLRECINLEVGLEYKSYQYVMCISTFKRIFFFAAPSDLVMFQWSTYLEKVKNAQDGDSIEVLDIGLRRKGGAGAVRTVRPSIVTRAFSNKSRGRVSSKQRSKSAIALMHFKGGGSTDTMDMRGESKGSQVSPILSPVTPTSDSSFKSEDASPDEGPHHERFPSLSSEYSSSSHSSTISKSGSLQFSPSRIYTSDAPPPTRVRSVTSDFRTIIIPSVIPPPKDIFLKKAARNKDGFFIDTSKSSDQRDSQTGSELSSTEDDKVASDGVSAAFAFKEGRLRRTPGIKKPSPKSEKKVMIVEDDNARSTPRDESTSNFSYNDNMKRSFRYKKINLRPPEKPLYCADDVVTDSEEDYDSESESKGGGASVSCVPGPQLGRGHDTTGTPDVSMDSILDESSDSVADSKSEDETLPPHSGYATSSLSRGSVLNRFKFMRQHPHGGNSAPKPVANASHQPHGRHSLANTYSRVTVLGTKEESDASDNFHVPERTPRPRIRSNSQPAITLLRMKPSLMEDTEAETKEEIRNTSMEAIRMRWAIDDVHSTSLPLDTDLISPSDLPERPSSEVFAELSQNSMDDLVIPPPEIFGAEAEPEVVSALSETTFKLESPKVKPKLSRTNNVSKTKLFDDEKLDDKENENSNTTSTRQTRNSISTDERQKNFNNNPLPESVNRNSTDSNDTGYTSTSPGYLNSASLQRQQKNSSQSQEGSTGKDGHLESPNQQHLRTPDPQRRNSAAEYRENFNAGISPDGRSTPIAQDDPRAAGVEGVSLKSYSSSHSLVSQSSDVSRMYVPLVFCSKRSIFSRVGGGSATRDDPNKFCVQVCLVENSEELIRDVVGVKTMESFTQVETEEVEGEGGVVTSEVDDFTVETSLEDLEFGFSITNSTQKDIFSRKVRQFTYEIQNLFGSQKPFSCDVEIRYGSQQTILCIEVA